MTMQDRFKFRFWNTIRNKYEDTYCCSSKGMTLDYVIPEQCTGIKDKNGKLIYEGDIIRVENNNCLITWDNDNARYNVGGYGEIAYLNYNEIEVIGNIHENPELLEKKMSKDKPEVGDVWEQPFTKIRFKIYDLIDSEKCTLVYYYHQNSYDTLIKDVCELNFFMQRGYKYVGKSSTTISDLFKTENE